MIWKNNPDLEVLNQIGVNTMVSHLEIEIVEIGDDYIKAKMPVNHKTKQPVGLLHGGASVALSESIGSIAAFLILENPSVESMVGIEINANHIRSVTSGYVYSTTTPIKVGKTIQVWNTNIYDEQEQLVCVSRLTTMRIRR